MVAPVGFEPTTLRFLSTDGFAHPLRESLMTLPVGLRGRYKFGAAERTRTSTLFRTWVPKTHAYNPISPQRLTINKYTRKIAFVN